MPSYRLSNFLPGAALGAASMLSRPVGRGIDEVERQDLLFESERGPTIIDSILSESGAIAPVDRSRSIGEPEGEPLDLFVSMPYRDPVALSEVEDRRKFHPVPDADLRTVRGSRTRLDASSLPQMAHVVRYVSSRNVITCVRRRIRRAVLLANGKGGANRYRPPMSEIICE